MLKNFSIDIITIVTSIIINTIFIVVLYIKPKQYLFVCLRVCSPFLIG